MDAKETFVSGIFLMTVLKYHSFVKRNLNTIIVVIYQGTESSSSLSLHLKIQGTCMVLPSLFLS